MDEMIIDTRTPIEIALDIDDEGMTTAKKLYAFLELDARNYSHWCKRNIVDNEFADENVDYWAFVLNDECGGQATTDYKLTAHFAKKLSIKGNGARADEAREYFTRIEEKAKQTVIDRSKLSHNTQMLFTMIQSLAEKELADMERDRKIKQIEESTQAIKEAVTPPSDNWREQIIRKVRRVQNATGAEFRVLNTEMYQELEHRAGCDLNTRLRNKQNRMYESGCTKTQINNLRKIDIIDEDKRLREIYEKIVTEYVIRYCA